MKKYSLLIFLFALIGNSILYAQNSENESVIQEIKRIENIVKEWGPKYGHPGGEILVTDNLNKTIYHSSFGSINKNEEFIVASATKPFTYGIVLILISEGKLSFDTKVNKYIPNVHPDVTVEMLLSHESGYINDFDDWFHGENFESVLNRFVDKGPTAIMGYHSYSEDNSFMLAKIVELVTGLAIYDAWIEKICKPLELKDTFGKLPNDYFNTTPFYLPGKDSIKQVNFLDWRKSDGVRFIHPSAGLFSTAEDYSKFLNGFKHLVSKEIFEKATHQQNNKEYGYGFQVYDDIGLYGHSGASGFAGFSNGEYTFIYWSPTILNAGRWKRLLRESSLFKPKSQELLTYYKELLPLAKEIDYLEIKDEYLGNYQTVSKIPNYNGLSFTLEKEGQTLKRVRGERTVDYWIRINGNEFIRVNRDMKQYYPADIIIWDSGVFKIYSKESHIAEKILILETIKK